MKMYVFLFLAFCQNLWADQVYKNSAGFPVCYQKDQQIYFFDWDDIVRTQNKPVFYFELDHSIVIFISVRIL